jgi:hypothetical protein
MKELPTTRRQMPRSARDAASANGTGPPDGTFELSIGPLEPLPFVGSVEVSVQAGTLCLLGAELRAGSGWHEVHSPAGGLPLALQTRSGVSQSATVWLRPIDPAVEDIGPEDLLPTGQGDADAGASGSCSLPDGGGGDDAGLPGGALLASLVNEGEEEEEEEEEMGTEQPEGDIEGEGGDRDELGPPAVWGEEAEIDSDGEDESGEAGGSQLGSAQLGGSQLGGSHLGCSHPGGSSPENAPAAAAAAAERGEERAFSVVGSFSRGSKRRRSAPASTTGLNNPYTIPLSTNSNPQASVPIPGGTPVLIPGGASVPIAGGAPLSIPGGAPVLMPGKVSVPVPPCLAAAAVPEGQQVRRSIWG